MIERWHFPEYLCLRCLKLQIMISPDQVLPHTSSNESVFRTEPVTDPLANWLSSSDGIARRVPDDVPVLPAHNEPFCDLHAHIGRLKERHEDTLEELLAALRESERVIYLLALMFRRPVRQDHLNSGHRRDIGTPELRDASSPYCAPGH